MDNATRNLLIAGVSFIAGAAAGGAGVYVYAKRYFKEQADAEIKDMADYYNNKYAEDILKKKEECTNEEGIKEESNAKEQAEYEEKAGLYSKPSEDEPSRTDYSDCYGDGKSGDNSSVDIPKKKKGGKKKKKSALEVVDESVWDENPGGLDTKFLIFYDADATLVDEDTEKVVEEVELAGFIENNEDSAIDDTLILQDNNANVLYHVTIMQASFSEVGLDD